MSSHLAWTCADNYSLSFSPLLYRVQLCLLNIKFPEGRDRHLSDMELQESAGFLIPTKVYSKWFHPMLLFTTNRASSFTCPSSRAQMIASISRATFFHYEA